MYMLIIADPTLQVKPSHIKMIPILFFVSIFDINVVFFVIVAAET